MAKKKDETEAPVKPAKKSESEIVAAYRKKHEAEKAELAEIGPRIAAVEKALTEGEKKWQQQFKEMKLLQQGLLIRKKQLEDQVAKDAENIGE